MPKKPQSKRDKQSSLSRLKPAEMAFLTDENPGLVKWDDYALFCLRTGKPGFGGDREPAALWTEFRGDVLPEFISKHPGRRPWPWWMFDAPRLEDKGTGCFWEGKLQEPRKLLSGKGCPPWDAGIAIVPGYEYGLPTQWVCSDENDPPTFESQSSYLERHGLLTPAEKRYLDRHPELYGAEAVKYDADPLLNDLATEDEPTGNKPLTINHHRGAIRRTVTEDRGRDRSLDEDAEQ
jgi:hypothetical protein